MPQPPDCPAPGVQGPRRSGQELDGLVLCFKLHLIVSDEGELLAVQLTPGNIDDRRPVEALSHDLFGKLFGDIAAPLGAGLVTPMLRLHLPRPV